MNNQRRKEIDAAIKQVEALATLKDAAAAALAALKDAAEDAASVIEAIRDAEQEYLDNVPESLQHSERYYDSEAAVSALDEAYEALASLSEAEIDFETDSVVGQLDAAKGPC